MRSLIIALLLALYAGNVPADMARGIELYEAGEVVAAEKIFARLATVEPANAAVFYRLGVAQMAQSHYNEAIDSFEQAVQLDDSVADHHRRLGEALGSLAGEVGPLKQMRLAGRIRDAFSRAVELDGSNIDARYGLMTYYLQAPGIAGGSRDKAEQQAAAIARLDAARGHLAYAAVFSANGENERADRAYRDAIAAQPDERDPYLALGISLTQRERYAEAIEIYEGWLQRSPEDMGILYQVGRTASISGQFLDTGQAALETYVDGYTPKPGEPSLAWGHYRLGTVYEHQGKLDLARDAFAAALAADPKHKQAKKASRRLR